jgi:hypothetical protein
MSESLTFRASRAKGLLVLVLSWCFVALGIPVGLFMIFSPNAMYLRLDQEGFEMGSLIRKLRIKWTDVRGFEMRRIHHNRMIAIIYAPHYNEQKIGRAVASTISGMEGGIANNYNASLDEILKTLNEWRARYAQ